MNFGKIAGFLGLILLIISLIFHFLTYRNINSAESYPLVWGLFPAAILIFVFFIVTLYLQIGNRPPLKVFYRHTLARMPFWTWILLAFFFGYLIFITFWFGLGLAIPEKFDGKYIINNHGQITEYTLEEVEMMKLNQFRQYSGFWIWLLLCSTLYLLTAKVMAEKNKKV
jgi:hypothetical protein